MMGAPLIVPADVGLPPWIYPPPMFEPIDQAAFIGIPAIGASAAIITLVVPPGRNGVIVSVANTVPAGATEGQNQVSWQILRGVGSNAVPVKGYNNILASLGAVSNPVRHPSGFRIFENETIVLQITNTSLVVAGQLCGGRFMGWYYDKIYEDPSVYV